MLIVTNVAKSYGEFTILDQINFTLSAGERVGLIGANGAGKSTLLKIIVGLEQADKGTVWLEPSTRTGYLAQALIYQPDNTVGQIINEALGSALDVLVRVEELANQIAIASAEEYDEVINRYAQALEEAERLDAYSATANMAQVLAGLGLSHLRPDTPVSILSGGQKTRLGLARLLLSRPDILLLDEPTNHLDITALAWLEDFIRSYKGAVLIVSHDRAFIDALVTKVLALDEITHTMKEFAGNYTDYISEVERLRQKQLDDYYRQQEYIKKVEDDIRSIKQRAKNTESSTINFAILKKAKEGARKAIVRERKLRRLLDSEERIDKPKQTWHMKLDFGTAPQSGQMVLQLENVSKAFEGRCIFSGAKLELKAGERVALLGANGSGKTTLLRIISGKFAPDEGYVRLGANVRVGYFSQEQEGLNPDHTVLESVRATAVVSERDARNFLHFFLFSGDEVFTPVKNLSYGERARLVLARLVLSGVNFLLLDEPLNHLDISAREQFEEALENFEGTILAVAHDRYFIQNFAERIYAFVGGNLQAFYELEDYEATIVGSPKS
jgi:ATP-binding cassette subfamily F protein 3